LAADNQRENKMVRYCCSASVEQRSATRTSSGDIWAGIDI
jgi:hypothetical protein